VQLLVQSTAAKGNKNNIIQHMQEKQKEKQKQQDQYVWHPPSSPLQQKTKSAINL